ncbi:hybrid sensor histidine kinase/response regulator [Variovorax sp. J22G73]|jgi:signal transduction histidine kinase/CheY-like chemotaxis protein|uniref:ATP-binding response regulator n=1 Tax=unclassified Variovorax TaxID=663243 RepID=UPI000D5F1EB1|nr:MULTISPECIES: hybrid sensor histidine kinase/response regulator [unclassified Variovorax]MDM0007795.1 hybrid sensor histidine kinase/response regulator [Variovorax sp. J22R203]MDM0100582.1 hybrid sensor histidine kinase/response regulator [Variovorax sp. J22G73]
MTSAAGAPLDDRALGQRVLREHVASVYASRRVSVSAHLCFAWALGVAFYWQYGTQWALFWLALITLVDLYALLTPGWHAGIAADRSPYWARKYTRLVTLVSSATAPAPLFVISNDNLPITTLLVVVIMSSWTRAMQALWPLKPALFGYGLPMMLGLIVALAWQRDALHVFLAVFGAAHLGLTLRTGIEQNRILTDALILRFENEALAGRLGEQIAATERASAEKTRFLGTASHDLRQPLHAIALFGAALRNELSDRPEGQNAERLMRAVDALGMSLDTMLDVSRLDAGVVTPVVRPVQLDALFLRMNFSFGPLAEQKALQLRVRASRLWVRSDPELLHRMLSNLVDNALKYTARGGVTVTARERGEAVWIEVRDTGMGIAPEQSGRIFEEFYQVGNPGRDRSRGLGIGLSIVQRLSRLLGHPVQLHSRLGRGTHFRVVVPRVAPPPGAAASALADAASLAPVSGGVGAGADAAPALPRRVLLVDDEADIRAAMTGLLRFHAIDVRTVADEAGALDELARAEAERQPFDMLLCDYRLADGADGLDAGLRLQQRLNSGVPLLLVTGETAPSRLQRVRESGVPVLFKPVVAEKLLQTMSALVSGRRAGH